MIFFKILAVYMLIVNLFLYIESTKEKTVQSMTILVYYLPSCITLMYILMQ